MEGKRLNPSFGHGLENRIKAAEAQAEQDNIEKVLEKIPNEIKAKREANAAVKAAAEAAKKAESDAEEEEFLKADAEAANAKRAKISKMN